MTFTLATLLLILAPVVVFSAVYLLIRRQILAGRSPSLPPDWTPELSADRYRPMFRLLEEDDIRFLRSQPGATPTLVRRLRKQRYQVFLGYLHNLQQDFHQACSFLMLLAAQADSDRGDILRSLTASRMKFHWALARVYWRLFLYRWNVARVPAGHLVSLFESLQFELAAFQPAPDQARG